MRARGRVCVTPEHNTFYSLYTPDFASNFLSLSTLRVCVCAYTALFPVFALLRDRVFYIYGRTLATESYGNIYILLVIIIILFFASCLKEKKKCSSFENSAEKGSSVCVGGKQLCCLPP